MSDKPTNVPARPQGFQLGLYVERTVRPSIEALLPAGTTMAAFETALRAAVLDKKDLMPAIAQNPESCLVALIKCARLGLSLNPVDKHFALVPKGGKIEGWVQYQGWQHLVCSSGAVEWMQADVVYKQEVDHTRPFFDPVTQVPNHVPHSFQRDSYKDDDIVGSYCCIKLKGQARLKSRLLSRGDLNKRRARGAANSPAWRDDFATMCIGKAIKALCQQPDVPRTKELADAMRAGLLEDDDERPAVATLPSAAALPSEPTPLPKAPQTHGDFLWEQREKDPLPDEATERRELLQVLEMAWAERAKPDSPTPTFDGKPLAELTIEELRNAVNQLDQQP